ncbi:hypothetical protein A6V39_03465 [Candidatus Mycoplasma haematobovis]|uniref:Uncharacterized protein n=1 Tax=Candidatus Mycoplasma haematobovis TaxID=432608 RepID=A0A1A9QCX5_9MOLU|nr:hypothetical protein [Candidatus Mycoplasma haematobovis]OAL09944.1 hypothetical protein A6V39_03465 [Candidatus Mycoplasma haematobovis]
MNTAILIGTATTLLTGLGVGGYFINDYLSERIDARLQGTKITGDADWGKKIIAIKAKTKELVADLARLTEAKELENWCNTNYNAKFKEYEDLRFKNVQTYCIYNNKDKLNKPIEAGGDWSKSKQALKDKTPVKDLSSNMQKIKAELTAQPTPNENALKNWCLSYYDEVWENSSSKSFTEASEYCVTKD